MKLLNKVPYVNIIGAIFVSINLPVLANCVWVITNPILAYTTYKNGLIEQSRMFAVFFIIALLGIIRETII